MKGLAILFLATAVNVFLRVFQQLNVIHDDVWLVPLGSYGMAFAELLIVSYGGVRVAAGQSLLATGFAIGTGGWLGCVLMLWMYR